MARKGLFLAVAVAVGLGFSLAVYAADEPKATYEKKDVKTLQGTVVDLYTYLYKRSEGKDLDEAIKYEFGKVKDAVKGTHEYRNTGEHAAAAGATTRPAGEYSRVKGFLVTEKDWLSKLVPGRELYVIVCAGKGKMGMEGHKDAAVGAKMTWSHLDYGSKGKITGHVFDEDGVRAISITNWEAIPTGGKEVTLNQ
jgi:hypothetical protein